MKEEYLPHLNAATIAFLESILTKKLTVLETGSGTSTIWFGKRVKRVVSFESSGNWHNEVMKLVNKEKLDNVIIYIDPKYPENTFAKFPGEFDLVFLDGADYKGARVLCMKQAPKLVKLEGLVLADDTHRRGYKEGITHLDTYLERLADFKGKDVYNSIDKKATVWKRMK